MSREMSRGDGEKEARRNIRYGDGAAAVGRLAPCLQHFLCQSQLQPIFTLIYYSLLVLHMLDYGLSVTARSKEDYSLSSFHHEFRREKGSQTSHKKRVSRC